MSSLLKHQACCINTSWQPRLASIDVCLAWHFSTITNQALPHLPTGLLHRRVQLFVFLCLCLSATLCLSGPCPPVSPTRSHSQVVKHWYFVTPSWHLIQAHRVPVLVLVGVSWKPAVSQTLKGTLWLCMRWRGVWSYLKTWKWEQGHSVWTSTAPRPFHLLTSLLIVLLLQLIYMNMLAYCHYDIREY